MFYEKIHYLTRLLSNKTTCIQHRSHLLVSGRKNLPLGIFARESTRRTWIIGRTNNSNERRRKRGESSSRAESAFIAPTSRLLMGRSKTGRNNPRPLRPTGMSGEGLGKATSQRGGRQPSEADDNTLRFGALSASGSTSSKPNGSASEWTMGDAFSV